MIFIWHENVTDNNTADGLVRRNQQKTVDLSSEVSTTNVKITHIVTELDGNNDPIYPADEIVNTSSIQIEQRLIDVANLFIDQFMDVRILG